MVPEDGGFEGNEGSVSSGVESQGTESGGGMNPAWTPLLEKLPPAYHNMITPVLKEWDSGVQNKLNQVQSQYAPFQEFLDNQIDPQQLQQAYGLYNLINQDPRRVYDELGRLNPEWSQQSGQGQNNLDEGEFPLDEQQAYQDIFQDPRLQQLAQGQDMIAQFISHQIQEQQNQKADSELDAALNSLKQQHGDFNEQVLLSIAHTNNLDLNDAMSVYHEFVSQARQSPGSSAPQVMPPAGGGVPRTQVDPAKMSGRDTRSLVAQMLNSMNQG